MENIRGLVKPILSGYPHSMAGTSGYPAGSRADSTLVGLGKHPLSGLEWVKEYTCPPTLWFAVDVEDIPHSTRLLVLYRYFMEHLGGWGKPILSGCPYRMSGPNWYPLGSCADSTLVGIR